jgi:hypothetical protein
MSAMCQPGHFVASFDRGLFAQLNHQAKADAVQSRSQFVED